MFRQFPRNPGFCAAWAVLIALIAATPASAVKISAAPLSGEGDYQVYFYSADRRGEAESLVERLSDLEQQENRDAEELRKSEARLAELDEKSGQKRATRLEWSQIEDVTGYSVKLYDANKKLIDTQKTDENSITLELAPGDYFFQVAAVTKYKTGTYSHMSRLKVSKGKSSEARQRAEEAAEALRERVKLAKKFRSGHAETLRSLAMGVEKLPGAESDVKVPDAAYCYTVNRADNPFRFSPVRSLPDRPNAPAAGARGTSPASAFLWGAGLNAGIQDTRLDFFRLAIGFEAFMRYDKPFLRFIYPQLKMTAAYSGAKTNVYDAMLQANLYPGIYYPLEIGRGFRFIASLGAGPNMFFILSSAASSSVLQWGVMPGVELQYALSERTSLYAGAGINFTFDPNGILKFVPISIGVTRHF